MEDTIGIPAVFWILLLKEQMHSGMVQFDIKVIFLPDNWPKCNAIVCFLCIGLSFFNKKKKVSLENHLCSILIKNL